ncbi:MAG: class I SAM-dependent methyltransferase [Pseudomonadota bacterium]
MSRDAQEKYYWAVKDGREMFDAKVRELSDQKDILEYGCATGDVSHQLAPISKSVSGIDISEVAIKKAQENAASNEAFAVMNAEEMDFDAGSFDFLFGCGIVHHLDVEKCANEVHRVLRDDGVAMFWEPLGHNVAINYYRHLTPEARTEDEHPLKKSDIETLKSVFSDVVVRHYGFFTIAGVPFRGSALGSTVFGITRFFDKILFSIPGLKWQSWYTIIECRK